MVNHLREGLSQSWLRIQGSLFPWLQEELGPLTIKQQQLVATLELIRIEEHLSFYYGGPGRPRKDRAAIARAFIAKMVYTIPCTSMLLERLNSDKSLRRICGWEYQYQLPSESVFSRAHAEFAASRLPERVHAAIIQSSYEQEIVGHISRDSTAINAREKPVKKTKTKSAPKKRGRPRRGEECLKTMTRLEKQTSGIPLAVMLDELPKACDVGTKRNSKGHQTSWIGYKLHIDAADGGIPVSCLLSSASMHDSQAAIPLAEITHGRICNLYDLMDSAYDAPQIHEHSQKLGHVPIIDINPRRNIELKQAIEAENKARKTIHHQTAEDVRYNERSTVERVNGRLKDEFGGRYVRVRGHAKVMCHLMFGILALTADQFMHMIQ
ncbi:MAG: transposase [Mariprofundaceae bacterium]|nr:transposase [Mariprofundaceae bacterium]